MKKNKLLTVAALSLCLLLTGYDDIVANPSNGKSPLVQFEENTEYFQNDYQKIYDSVVSGGTINTYTLEKLVQIPQPIHKFSFTTSLIFTNFIFPPLY